MLNTKQMTVEEFAILALSDENANRSLEFINGEIVEVSPGRTRYSEVGNKLVFKVYTFCSQHNIVCHTSGSEGAYRISGSVIAPDFAYKRTPMSEEYPDPDPPLWVVEIISPTDKAADIRDKREIYRRAGILLWEVYLRTKSVDVYAPGQAIKTYSMGEILNGGDVLPEFKLAVADLFA
jgi:Uma2 family endonuclease